MKISLVTTSYLAVLALASASAAAELQPETAEAFERYIEVTEARIQTELAGDAPFLWLDRLGERKRAGVLRRLEAGEVVVDRLETRDGGMEIDIPKGMISHWVGTVLIPNVSVDETIALVQDYDRYPEIYAPDVRAAVIRQRDGNRFQVYLQLYTKKVITWVANADFDVEFLDIDETRAHVPSRSTRIQEVEHPDTPEERETPEGNDRGVAWRMYNYCSFEERDEGTIMQCENITLSRSPSFLLSMIVKPFVISVPKDKLTFTLEAARRHLTGGASGN